MLSQSCNCPVLATTIRRWGHSRRGPSQAGKVTSSWFHQRPFRPQTLIKPQIMREAHGPNFRTRSARRKFWASAKSQPNQLPSSLPGVRGLVVMGKDRATTYTIMYEKSPPRGQAVFMRRACAPTPPPRWPAAHSARRSTAHAANAPRAAPSHTSRARSPPTRALTPPLFYDSSHVDKFPAPKALIPT